MTCEECEQILLDSRRHRNGKGWVLRVSTATLIEAHIKNCPTCATKMTETTRLEDALDQLRVATQQFQAPPEIEKNLLDAFRQETARRQRSFDNVFAWKLAWLCTATLVVVAAGLFLYSRLRPSPSLTLEGNRPGHEARIEATPAQNFPGTATEAYAPPNHATAKDDIRGSTHHIAKAQKATHESIIGRAGIPGEELSMNDGGSIVRVTLSVSSLVAMGVPVRPELSESRVTADVWMDPFGAVLGVRLVQPNPGAD